MIGVRATVPSQQLLIKLNVCLSYNPAIPLQDGFLRERKTCPHDDLYMDVHSSLICNCQNWKQTTYTTSECINKLGYSVLCWNLFIFFFLRLTEYILGWEWVLSTLFIFILYFFLLQRTSNQYYQLLIKLNICLSYNPAIPLWAVFPRERKTCPHDDLYMNVHSSLIYNCQKLEAI